MTTTTSPATLIPIEPPLLPTLDIPFYRFTRQQLRDMEKHGIIRESSQYELIDGILLEKPVAEPIHDTAVTFVTYRLMKRIPEGWFLRMNNSFDLDTSEPIPDGAIVRGDLGDYREEHPTPADIGIAIEISNSSLRRDRSEKGALYSSTAIPVYWIINLGDRQIEVYSDPEAFKTPASYATQAIYKPGDAVPIVLDGQTVATIPVDELLP